MNSDNKLWLRFWLERFTDEMEIRLLPSGSQTWSRDIDTLEKAIDEGVRRGENVYFGVLGRKHGQGGKEGVSSAHCLWADIDFKELHGGQVEADGIIGTFDHRPSMHIASGGGYHVYWFLSEPTNDLERVDRILKGLVPRLKSDIKVAEVARILRVPGTKNVKYAPPKDVKVVSFLPEYEYTLDDFKEWELPEEVRRETPADDAEPRVNLPQYLKHYKVPVVKTIKRGTATLYCLKQCLFEEGHTTAKGEENQAAIGQQEDGKLFYQCFHAHCADKVWADVRKKISGEDPLTPFAARDLKKLIDRYVAQATGQFSIGHLISWLDIKTFPERELAASVLADLEKERTILRTGAKHGIYRLVDKNPHVMDLRAAKQKPLDVLLPFDLHRIVNLYSRNVILCAGEKDAGKTSFAMNAGFMNRDKVHVTYFNSEMGPDELLARVANFPDKRISEWSKITWIERASRFEDFIDPDGFNIIDFLEVGADAYAVVEDIKRVFDRLHKGLLLIVMQKRSYKEWAVGGEGTLEKARLAVNLEHRDKVNVCKITVAKNWTGEVLHPRGRECKYKVFSGGKIEMDGSWYDPDQENYLTPRKQKKLRVVTSKDKDFVKED